MIIADLLTYKIARRTTEENVYKSILAGVPKCCAYLLSLSHQNYN